MAPVEVASELAAAYTAYQRLSSAGAPAPASLDELVAGAAGAAPAEAPAPVGAASELAEAYTAYQRLSWAGAPAPASLDELIAAAPGAAPAAAPASAADVVPIEALAPDDASVVEIETLLYSGPDALRRALALRLQLDARLAADGPGGPEVTALLGEVFDLIQLGLGAGR